MSAQNSRTKINYMTESTWGVNPAGTAGYQEVTFSVSKSGSDSSGLTNDTTVYEATIAVDGGVAQDIAIVGKEAQTFNDVIAEINKDLSGASIALESGDLRVTSDSLGASSSIAITDTDLFSSLTSFSAVGTAVSGTAGDGANYKNLPFVSFSINESKDIYNDDTVRSDRRRQFNVHGNKSVSGDITVNLGATVYDTLLESALYNSFSTNDLIDGTTEKSLSIEAGQLDINQYRVFTGIIVNGLSISVPVNGIVSATFSVMGKEMSISNSTIDASVTDASIDRPFYHAGGTFKVGGVEVGHLSSIELSVDNEGEANQRLGSDAAKDISVGFTTISGTATVYFEDAQYFNDFKNEADSSMNFSISDGTNDYTFDLPKIKYDGVETTLEGQGSILLNVPFTVLSDGGNELIKITRNVV